MYYPSLDGLRAVAILLVLFFHAGSRYVPSGFIGVDIFFVISGFLIMGIIYQSLQNNTFSFIQFYKRRLWRLQPAFIAVLLCVSLGTLLLYLPEDLLLYSKSVRKSAFFVANQYFEKTTTGYFSPDIYQLPLLHMWSLSIEWQYYLLLPVLTYVLYRIIPEKYFRWGIYTIAGTTFFYAMYVSGKYPESVYFQLSSRLFEFFIGASIALFPQNISIPKKMVHLITMTALIGLIILAMQKNLQLGFPDWYAAIVCLFTGILLLCGRMGMNTPVNYILASKPMVFIGLLSYSLYIWHWPILAFIRYYNVTETTFVLFNAFLAIFIIAFLSWKYIEKPARQLHSLPWMPTVACLFLVPVLFAYSQEWVLKKNTGFPGRFQKELVDIYATLQSYKSKERPLCIGQKKNADCQLGSHRLDSKKAFMFGDSFSNHFWGFMDVLGKDANMTILSQSTSSCLTLPGIYLYDWWHFKNTVYQECKDETERYFTMVQNNHYDFVIIGQAWINYLNNHIVEDPSDTRSVDLSRTRFENALDKALQMIIASGAKPMLVQSTASMKTNFHDCFFKHIKLRQSYDPTACSFTWESNETEEWLQILFQKMQKKYTQLILLDPKQIQCKNAHCRADVDGIPVYRDVGHITDYASWKFGELYLKELGNPFKIIDYAFANPGYD